MSKNKNFPWSKSLDSQPIDSKPENSPNPSSKNAIKHGCCAAGTLILPHENESDYKSLEATWCKAYNPQSEPERHLVQELINADWLLQRTTAAYAQIEADLYTVKCRLTEKAQTEKQNIAQERLKIYKDKNRPEPNWKEHLQNMKEKAISLGFTPPPMPLDPTRRY